MGMRISLGWMAVVAVVPALLGASCSGGGGGGGVESCTVSQNDGTLGTAQVCLEGPPAAFSNGCKATGTPVGDASVEVHVVPEPCSRTDALGACQTTSGGVTESVWYYGTGVEGGVGPSAADIMTLCELAHATYLSP
jgi:hypothetical protein